MPSTTSWVWSPCVTAHARHQSFFRTSGFRSSASREVPTLVTKHVVAASLRASRRDTWVMIFPFCFQDSAFRKNSLVLKTELQRTGPFRERERERERAERPLSASSALRRG